MLKISQIKCPVNREFSREDIASKLHCRPEDILSYTIDRSSLDARHDELVHVYSVYAKVRNESVYLRRRDVEAGEPKVYEMPKPGRLPEERPLIAGFGPSGMFAALILAECGYRPIVIERGRPVEQRTKDVERFFRDGILDSESNIQYGEGGAGTFSDGKLTARSKDLRVQKVMEELIEAGADPEIAWQAMPHIGTDVLQKIVRNIREKVCRLGGEIRFETRLERLHTEAGKLHSVQTSGGEIPCRDLLLCTGHSAQETYAQLLAQKISIVQKDFAVGVRVEHPQQMIDRNQYGRHYGEYELPAASYRLTHTSSAGRGVYSFCMCPGGIVIPSMSEPETMVVNGMSYAARDGKNANSAILVQVFRRDFDSGHPLDGFRYQKKLETQAYIDGYTAPVQNIRDYLDRKVSQQAVIPSSYPRDTAYRDMSVFFNDEQNTSLAEAFLRFDRQIHGFADHGIMVGLESRSSSPIRILRGTDGMSAECEGLYPCGEGAGYAGGIVSSAVDGIRQAENLLKRYAVADSFGHVVK